MTPQEFHDGMPKSLDGLAPDEIIELAGAYIELLHLIVSEMKDNELGRVTLGWTGFSIKVVQP